MLQEITDGTDYRTAPARIVPGDVVLRWGLVVVGLLDDTMDYPWLSRGVRGWRRLFVGLPGRRLQWPTQGLWGTIHLL